MVLTLSPAFAQDCKTDADCEKGSACKVQKVACEKDPHTSTCAKLICQKLPVKK